jgi:hypothetical protein
MVKSSSKLLEPAAWKARAVLCVGVLIAVILVVDLMVSNGRLRAPTGVAWLTGGLAAGALLGLGSGLTLRAQQRRAKSSLRDASVSRGRRWTGALLAAGFVGVVRLGPAYVEVALLSTGAGFGLALLPFVSDWFHSQESKSGMSTRDP